MLFIFRRFPKKYEFSGRAEMIYISQYTSVMNKRRSNQITNLILLSEGRNQIAQSRIWTQDRLATKPISYRWTM